MSSEMSSFPRLFDNQYVPLEGTSIMFYPKYGPCKINDIFLDNCLYPPGTIRRRGTLLIIRELRDDGSSDFSPIPKEELDRYLKLKSLDDELNTYIMDRCSNPSNKKARIE